jgi:hypothetical protein
MRPHPADDIINRHHLNLARRCLGHESFQAAWASGHQTPAETAVGMALASPAASRD